jgi:hypothetical protein
MVYGKFEAPTVIAQNNHHFQLEQSSVIKTAPPGRQSQHHNGHQQHNGHGNLHFSSPKHEPLDISQLTENNLQVNIFWIL